MAKTIVEKLKLDKYTDVAVLHEPDGSSYFQELSGYDTSLQRKAYDLVFGFVLDMPAMQRMVQDVLTSDRLLPNGYLFMAYPKKGNRVYDSYIHRDELFAGLGSDEEGYIGTSTLRFARMVGLDEVFTVVGLKMDKVRKAPETTSSRASQRVEDYAALVPEVERDLADEPELLAIYQALTPGYRKDWARHIYSAKQEKTQVERKAEMKRILQAGYKSRELYRQAQSEQA